MARLGMGMGMGNGTAAKRSNGGTNCSGAIVYNLVVDAAFVSPVCTFACTQW